MNTEQIERALWLQSLSPKEYAKLCTISKSIPRAAYQNWEPADLDGLSIELVKTLLEQKVSDHFDGRVMTPWIETEVSATIHADIELIKQHFNVESVSIDVFPKS